jgi:two-component system KDP operon response regulator KdpE
MGTTILVADDEASMRKYISSNLKVRGYDVIVAADGLEALKLAGEHPLDLVLLDIGMPGPDGTQVLAALRRESRVPVIMVSARGREQDKVQALDLGADDYLTKPFGVDELMARVRVSLRRAGSLLDSSLETYRHRELEVDFSARQVRVSGHTISMTPKQYAVLAYLARNAGKVLTHRQILQTVWGGEYGDEIDYVWTYVRRIRRRIEPEPASCSPSLGLATACQADQAPRAQHYIGMRTVTVVPWPSSLCTDTRPSCILTVCHTLARPSPVPVMAATLLPRRYGANTNGRSGAGMPTP